MRVPTLTLTVCVLVAGLTGCGEAIQREIDKEVEKADKQAFTVDYEVTGVGPVDLEYTVFENGKSRSVQEPKAKLPWRKKITMSGITTVPSLSLIRGETAGTSECAVSVNGKPAKRMVADGPFSTAVCVEVGGAGQS